MWSKLLLPMVLCCLAVETYAQKIADTEITRKDTTTAPTLVVESDRRRSDISTVADIERGIIYAAKKTERVVVRGLVANTASNVAREALSTVAGLNIWESDGGLQLGIGGRGLSPNRTSHFTTRQNGYDISADPLGYPESYYTPPLDFVERIDIVRGAGSLRYGTQFGGTINFIMRRAAYGDDFAARTKLAYGSYDTWSGMAEVSGRGSTGGYLAAVQRRSSMGWRPNSRYDVVTGYASVDVALSGSVRLSADYTGMAYDAQQPGGLTDKDFAADPDQSVRSRNWFAVRWNIASLRMDWIVDTATSVHSLLFGNMSSRSALGNLDRINIIDLGAERTMISGDFLNIGNETVLQHRTRIGGRPTTVVTGVRLFHGTTTQQQGQASAGSGADFGFNRPDSLDGSDYLFPNDNAALFAEALVDLGEGFSIVPGIRLEHITTRAEGYYAYSIRDFAGNIVVDSIVNEERTRSRSFLIAGVGVKYMPENLGGMEIYANVSQNYRSITFTDLRVVNPNVRVDPNIADERGYTADVGLRGPVASWLTVDASAFYLSYANKIGEVLRANEAPLFLPYRYRTNISDAYTAGVEAVADVDIVDALGVPHNGGGFALHGIANVSVLGGRYLGSQETSIRGKDVEFVPPYTVRAGLRCAWNNLRATLTYSAVARHFTDASNATYTASAVTGVIPAYQVLDVSAALFLKPIVVTLSCNNALDARYFTRRAESYPGPGIVPADARSITLAVEYTY